MATKKMTTRKRAPKKQEYVIARCKDAGVHAGYLVSTNEHHTVLRDSRRIWYWTGAASLSEIAVYGIRKDKISGCKIGAKEIKKRLRDSDICELTVCCDAGRESLEGAPEWRA